jgi:ABC-2 type transport system ATP-binding protein
MTDHAVVTRALSKNYGQRGALFNIDLEVPANAICALVGANGAGKSTTLRVLMNLERADAGHAEVLGLDTARRAPETRAHIGYIAERGNIAYPHMTCSQLLHHVSNYYLAWDHDYATRLQAALSVPRDQRLDTLSKGETRRLQWVIALAHYPPVLLLDEPTEGLDLLMRARALSLLADHLAQADTTVLISTHHIHELESLVDHIAVMHHGQLKVQASRDDLRARFRAYDVELPSRWTKPAELHVLVAEGGERTKRLIVEGAESLSVDRLVTSGATVHGVRVMTLEEIALALLKEDRS